ncbi:hypothetical protein AQJ27_37175 [Streptomyces olivochromogenes]|nr:hypothetical protein AQJ27_37175 [Streptomyces olivochromogenes]
MFQMDFTPLTALRKVLLILSEKVDIPPRTALEMLSHLDLMEFQPSDQADFSPETKDFHLSRIELVILETLSLKLLNLAVTQSFQLWKVALVALTQEFQVSTIFFFSVLLQPGMVTVKKSRIGKKTLDFSQSQANFSPALMESQCLRIITTAMPTGPVRIPTISGQLFLMKS